MEELQPMLAQWWKVALFFLVRLVMAPCVESLILLDRAHFLKEKGTSCPVCTLQDCDTHTRTHACTHTHTHNHTFTLDVILYIGTAGLHTHLPCTFPCRQTLAMRILIILCLKFNCGYILIIVCIYSIQHNLNCSLPYIIEHRCLRGACPSV